MDFERLFTYDLDANRKVLEMIRKQPAAMPDDVMKLFSHILAAQEIWNSRIQQRPQELGVWERLDPEAMALRLEKNYTDSMALSAEKDRMAESVPYATTRGDAYQNSRSDILSHVLMHSMYHRGQIARSLRENGFEPPETNYIFYVREQNPSL